MGLRKPEEFPHHRAQVNDVEIHYVLEGVGEPLLLLHGWPGFWWEWHKSIPELSITTSSSRLCRESATGCRPKPLSDSTSKSKSSSSR